MDYNVTVREASALTIASVRGRARPGAIGETLIPLLTRVWSYISLTGLAHAGQNVAIYRVDDGDRELPCTGVLIEAGVVIPAPFQGDGEVVCSATPAGVAASALHIGPYENLGNAHRAIVEWCAANGRALSGVSWEVYGHWTDNAEKLETEVFYQLEEFHS